MGQSTDLLVIMVGGEVFAYSRGVQLFRQGATAIIVRWFAGR